MIYKNDETRQNILKGAEIIYDAVRTTLGPKGRNVLIRDKFGQFTITHDGVTVAKAVQLKDEPETIGVEVVKEASRKMNEVGDGTTTVTVLTYHLINEAQKLIDNGVNPMHIKRQMEAAIPDLIDRIEAKSKKIDKNYDDVRSVAAVSCGNEELGTQIADLMTQIGYEGAISVEQTQTPETTFKVVEGFAFDRGYMSPYFVTDQGARECVLKSPAVILINGSVHELQDYENIFNVIMEAKIKNVLIIAENVEDDALNTLILNKVKGVLNVCAVKVPGYGDDKLENLKDLAAVTGGKVIDPSVGDWQDDLTIETLGAAEKAVISYDQTIIIGGQGDTTNRAEKLEKRLTKAKEDEKDKIKDRIANLKSSVGIIKVGGQTESEAEEKKYRVDDAVSAVKAAMKGGIVAGGGMTLNEISGDFLTSEDEVDVMIGIALCKPLDVLWENSGLDVKKFKGKGVNVLTGEEVDMFEAGIVDPTDVTKEVVRNALITAGLALTVGGSIVDKQLSQEELSQLYNAGQNRP